jgi:ABC-type uncharacterized transport system involved in gliding motility auxiliary subunit
MSVLRRIAGISACVLIIGCGLTLLLTSAGGGLVLTGFWSGWVLLLIALVLYLRELRGYLSRQSTRYGLNLALLVIVSLAIAGLLEVIAANRNVRFDLTPTKDFTLSDYAQKVLESLDRNVTVTVFYQGGQRADFEDLLKRFVGKTPLVTYAFYNLDQNPAKAKEYGVGSYGATVVESEGRRKRFNYCTEDNIVTGILNVISEKKKVIGLTQGHGERDLNDMDQRTGSSSLKRALEIESYEIRDLVLLREKQLPEDISLLVVNGPQREFLPEEVETVDRYLRAGGNALFLIEPYTAPQLVALLARYNVILGDDIVVDKESRLFGGDYLSPILPILRQHSITEGLGAYPIFSTARSIEAIEFAEEDVAAKGIAKSSPESWAESDRQSTIDGFPEFDEEKDKQGPISVAAVFTVTVWRQKSGDEEGEKERIRTGRVMVCGDSDFASNLYFDILGNKDFLLNSLNWLTEKEELISARKRGEEAYPLSALFLTDQQSRAVFFSAVIVQPLVVLLVGIVIYTRRKMWG